LSFYDNYYVNTYLTRRRANACGELCGWLLHSSHHTCTIGLPSTHPYIPYVGNFEFHWIPSMPLFLGWNTTFSK